MKNNHDTDLDLTNSNINPYEFVGKPSFPKVGQIHSDSIDWGRDKPDGYTMGNRYGYPVKSQKSSDKARVPKADSTFNRNVELIKAHTMAGSIAESMNVYEK